MSGKIIVESKTPVTQSSDAVRALLAFQGKDVAEMPPFYRLSGEMVLVRSNKGDAYYVVTPKACSCPAAIYHPMKPCKHRRAYFPQLAKVAQEPVNSIRPDMSGFRPVSPLPGEIEEVA